MVAVLPSCLLGETKNIFDKHQPFIRNYFITKYKLMISNHLPLTRKPLIKCMLPPITGRWSDIMSIYF
jgi:hypothetical protein